MFVPANNSFSYPDPLFPPTVILISVIMSPGWLGARLRGDASNSGLHDQVWSQD